MAASQATLEEREERSNLFRVATEKVIKQHEAEKSE